MTSLRIRKPVAATFLVLVLASAYLGLTTQKIPSYGQSDKGMHLVTFFLLTATFYWIIETSRKRAIYLTAITCLIVLSIGSEVVQALLPNGRNFDPFDILANMIGSLLALALSNWYHKRMLERRRKSKHYNLVPGDELEGAGNRDVELGEGVGATLADQETGTALHVAAAQTTGNNTNVTEELDRWDENADDDWDAEGGSKPLKGAGS